MNLRHILVYYCVNYCIAGIDHLNRDFLKSKKKVLKKLEKLEARKSPVDLENLKQKTHDASYVSRVVKKVPKAFGKKLNFPEKVPNIQLKQKSGNNYFESTDFSTFLQTIDEDSLLIDLISDGYDFELASVSYALLYM